MKLLNKNLTGNILMIATLLGCNVPPPIVENDDSQIAPDVLEQSPVSTTTENSSKSVSFLDLDSFDQDISSALDAQDANAVAIVFAAPATVNQIPLRLSKWLSVVKDSGGEIKVEPMTRAIGLSLLFALPQIYSYLKESMLYSPAKNYNVVISHNPQTGVIDKFTFLKR